jgi:general secretion pathway protein K
MRRARGFVLLNALVLVAAFAAAAVYVLGRADRARLRQADWQGAGQMALYLDAYEALALTLLRRDQLGGAVDSRTDLWAQEGGSVAIDRGRLSGQISDLQGRFNVNWLANSEDLVAGPAFVRLVVQLGVSATVADDIAAFVSPGGPQNNAAYDRLTPAVVPLGGPLGVLDQLRRIPSLRARDYDRLRPYLAALPGDSRLNLNTSSAAVLASLLPGSNVSGLGQLLQSRRQRPFVSVEDFFARATTVVPASTLVDLDLLRFAVGSQWFRADIAVELEGRILTRQTIFQRRPLPYGPQVAYRLGGRP